MTRIDQNMDKDVMRKNVETIEKNMGQDVQRKNKVVRHKGWKKVLKYEIWHQKWKKVMGTFWHLRRIANLTCKKKA